MVDYESLIVAGQRKNFDRKLAQGQNAYRLALSRGLTPTPYFFEAVDYVRKAALLQTASLANQRTPIVGDPLMEAIPIYNTVQRRYAGFSNVPELLWYGESAPKLQIANSSTCLYAPPNVEAWRTRDMSNSENLDKWLYLTLVHRITGSGASFERDHGFRNNRVLDLRNLPTLEAMGDYLFNYSGPLFTSIGNQIPPFPKIGGRAYLQQIAPALSRATRKVLLSWHGRDRQPMPIKRCVDTVLRLHSALGCKQFKFVLTAWVMDMAEYLPQFVDPNSDVYHGKNAVEAMHICFEQPHGKERQKFYDLATRLFSDVTGTLPMDVEDASPGCDLVRWIENYVPKRGYDHVHEQKIYNGSSLVWNRGRQPLKG